MKDQKVFVIGFHKTGLTSLGKALELLQYRVCHRAKPLREALGHEEMIQQLEQKSYEKVFEIAREFDAFHDNPWFWLYRELDQQFPGSKFILSTRGEASWLASAQRYFGNTESDFRRLVYGQGSIVGNEQHYLEYYRKHNTQVREWFKDRPNDLLEIDVIAAPQWEELCGFLKAPIPSQAFPHLNASQPPSLLNRIKRGVKNQLRKG